MSAPVETLRKIATKLDELALHEDTGELVRAVASAGRLLWEAHQAGALDTVEWIELSPCFDLYASGTFASAPLEASRRLFTCTVDRLVSNCGKKAAAFSFRHQDPSHPQAYEWEWVRSSLRSLARLVEAEADRLSVDRSRAVAAPQSRKNSRPASGKEKWRTLRKRMLKLLRCDDLPDTIRATATKLASTYSTVLAAVHRSPILAAHFKITPNKVSNLLAALNDELTDDSGSTIKALGDKGAELLERQWKGMDPGARAELAKMLLHTDRKGAGRALGLIENADSAL